MPSEVVAAVAIVETPTFSLREFFGNVATKDGKLSAVHEKFTAPATSMPWRCPKFTEYILMIAGEVHVEHNGGKVVVKAGSGVFLPAGCRVRVSIPEAAEFCAICLPAFSPDIEHAEGEGVPPNHAHATATAPALAESVDVVKAPDLTITEFFGNVTSRDEKLSACVAKVAKPCSEAWQKPEFAEWVLVLDGILHIEHAEGITKVPAGSGVFLAANERVKWVWPEPCTYVPICMPAFTPDGCHREVEEGSAKDEDPETMAKLEELHAKSKRQRSE